MLNEDGTTRDEVYCIFMTARIFDTVVASDNLA